MNRPVLIAVVIDDFPYHYGPTDADPDPGKTWHIGCGGEVLFIEDGLICVKCGAQAELEADEPVEPLELAPETVSVPGAYYQHDKG